METEKKALKEIALSLSGGGYRAAAFHLGTLEMLDRLGLLPAVTVLSTISGGTITGATYAAALAEGLSFERFYAKLYGFLRDKNVITTALANLQKSVFINQTVAMPSLIRAAANVYAADDLLGNKTLAFLLEAEDSPLQELAFNATDFRTGNSFRFQKSRNPGVTTGNNFAPVSAEVNSLIRLADIVAASSCFPSGFEPIRFPSDFVWGDGEKLNGVREALGERFSDDIPLMDGGIFDNQGIDSIENVYRRKGDEISLYIISDTSQRATDLLTFPPQKKSGRLPLVFLYGLIWFLFGGSVFTILTLITEFVSAYKNGELSVINGVFLYLIPFVFSLGIVFLIALARHHAIKMQRLIFEQTGFELWRYVKNLTVPEVIELIDARLKSVIVMTSSVFMKRIRALGFDRVFADLSLRDRLVPNLIYDLDNEERWGDEIKVQKLQPSEKLRAVARRAESYPTNLWFLHQENLDNLIFCGRATICFKILKYLLGQKSAEIAVAGSTESELFNRVRNTWIELNK